MHSISFICTFEHEILAEFTRKMTGTLQGQKFILTSHRVCTGLTSHTKYNSSQAVWHFKIKQFWSLPQTNFSYFQVFLIYCRPQLWILPLRNSYLYHLHCNTITKNYRPDKPRVNDPLRQKSSRCIWITGGLLPFSLIKHSLPQVTQNRYDLQRWKSIQKVIVRKW